MAEPDCTRRDFLKTLALGAIGMALGGRRLAGRVAGQQQPNVILIFTDDQGTLDVNCYGSKDLYTPSLDRLAQEGTRFTQFYVGQPVCSPSRASLLTGRYPLNAGVPRNVGRRGGLPLEQITIAEMLKEAGYRTAIVGKWHLGEAPELSPLRQGFDEFFGHKKGCIDNYSHFFYWSGPNRHDLWRNEEEYWADGQYFPEMVAREACSFIEKSQDNPFFLYLAFNMPHYPTQGLEKYRQMYVDVDEPRKSYAAFVSTLDEKIGEVVGKVDELGLRENTLIIFLSDHGHSVEERTNFGGGNAGPYRGSKFTLWEGGIRVPCIVSWPGRIAQGAVRDQVAIAADWLPTIADYCGLQPPDWELDGRNIKSIIKSSQAESPHKILYWQHKNQWAVREGDWKLVVNAPPSVRQGKELPYKESDKVFLSNMAQDMTETNNLADTHPDIVKRLTSLHEEWITAVEQG